MKYTLRRVLEKKTCSRDHICRVGSYVIINLNVFDPAICTNFLPIISVVFVLNRPSDPPFPEHVKL
jgi:hypothetical protein